MRFKSILGLALIFTFTAPLFAADSPFLGKWTASAVTPNGDVSETLAVTKTAEGYAVAAKLVAPAPGQPEAGPGEEIVLDGDKFSYKRTVEFGGNKLVITYSGVVSGDAFTGTIDMGGMGQVPYKGVRIKE